jgi:hypothetical protein
VRKLAALAIVVALLGTALSSSASDGYTYQTVGAPAQASSGLTITLDSAQLIEKTGSFQLRIVYTQKNNTSDKKLDEGRFKLFFTDGTTEPQYGFYNSLFPGYVNVVRTYTCEWVKGKEPWLIEWEAGFFTNKNGLNWKIGSSYPTSTPSQTATPSPSPSTSPRPSTSPTPTPSPSESDAPAVASPSYKLLWKGKKLSVTVSNAPVPSTLSLKIGEKSYKSKASKAPNFTYSVSVNPSTLMTISLNGQRMDLIATPEFDQNCQDIWKMFDGGLTPNSAQKNKGAKLKKTPTVHFVGAVSNSSLDKDRDGLVCER